MMAETRKPLVSTTTRKRGRREIVKGEQGDSLRHTKAVFPVRDRVFLVPPECGTTDIRESRVKSIIQC
jgi:hypothetical protein